MHHVGGKEQMGKSEEDEVEEPEAQDGHRSERVEAHGGAARLDGVADKALLLVAEEGEAHQQQDGQAQTQHQSTPGLT